MGNYIQIRYTDMPTSWRVFLIWPTVVKVFFFTKKRILLLSFPGEENGRVTTVGQTKNTLQQDSIKCMVIPAPFTCFGCKYPQSKANSLKALKAHLECLDCLYGPNCTIYYNIKTQLNILSLKTNVLSLNRKQRSPSLARCVAPPGCW